MQEPITQRWRRSAILADGAMGTLLFARGAATGTSVEGANLDRPADVLRAHAEYLSAGAEFITTNTFAANRLKLAAHDLTGRLEQINAAGVRLARAAADGNAYIAASIGPTGALLRPLGPLDPGEAFDVFAEQIAALAGEVPDLLLLETFGAVGEALVALDAAKRTAPTLPVLVSLSVVDDGTTPAGDDLGGAFAILRDGGADALGVNCAVGPQALFDALAPHAANIVLPFSVMPNAGFPENIDGRTVYRAAPAYFAMFARDFVDLGAAIVGGCCGTTPDVIKAMAPEVRGKAIVHDAPARRAPAATLGIHRSSPAPHAPGPAARFASLPAERSLTAFERKLGRDFVVTVEITPPRGVDCAAALEGAKLLEAAGADSVDIADNPTARLRMSSLALAHLIRRETLLAAILHLTCRDRNLLALQSDLLGAAALDVTAILALTGDPSNVGDFPRATSVFDVTAAGLTEMVHALNAGRDLAGNSLGAPTRFRVGVAVNPLASDLDVELSRFEEMRRAGADFAMTQPVYDVGALAPFLTRANATAIPLIVAVLPLRSYRNAEYFHNEVPGMSIPDSIRERMRLSKDGASEGADLACELLAALRATPGVAGAYIMPQGRYEIAADILRSASTAARG
ncbi:MAG TPA: bifunctional homocysteine S-methyltransferase/methylenetetrahydrofolate reductase [Candidatus Eremiobacteraceae bacterium]|nr:bifunctional homocysteine S-methyltransferase/methylenetetrahydrofolate reductase [Candidatus Eremiobacteraceae bacterium]